MEKKMRAGGYVSTTSICCLALRIVEEDKLIHIHREIELKQKEIKMWWLELRYASMLIINILKSFIDAEAWDAFGVMSNWNKFSFLSLLFLLISFYSIKISPHLQIQVRFHNFNPLVLLSLFFSLILPQRACWPYFLIVWLSTYDSFSALINSLIHCFEAVLPKIPGCNIGTTTIDFDEAVDLEMGNNDYEEDISI